MKIRCLLVDDEKPARDELRFLLSSDSEIDIVADTDSADKACALIRKEKPDLVFLDIQMPGRNGFDVIEELSDLTEPPIFVFVTAFDNHAVQAFEKSALDYILKPISTSRLEKTILRVKKILGAANDNSISRSLQSLLQQVNRPDKKEAVRISVECGGKIQLLVPEDIVYCSLQSNRIMVHTGRQACPLYGINTMDKLAEHLNKDSFFRIHRSVLVNLDHIKEFSPWINGKYNLIMDDHCATELTVSRMRAKEFKQKLGIWTCP